MLTLFIRFLVFVLVYEQDYLRVQTDENEEWQKCTQQATCVLIECAKHALAKHCILQFVCGTIGDRVDGLHRVEEQWRRHGQYRIHENNKENCAYRLDIAERLVSYVMTANHDITIECNGTCKPTRVQTGKHEYIMSIRVDLVKQDFAHGAVNFHE